jgi:hypothetical protein
MGLSGRSFADRSALARVRTLVVSSTEYVVRSGSMVRPLRSVGSFIFKPLLASSRMLAL